MKRFFTLMTLLLVFSGTKAQPWFDVGIKGGVGTSFMYNRQIFDDQDLTHKFKPGYTFGAKLGYNFIQWHQITLDVLKTSLDQGFIYYPEAGVETIRDFKIESLDFALMYRYNDRGTYLEIGPQLSLTSNVKYTDEGGDHLGILTPDKLINKKLMGLAAGFGGYLFGTDNFGVTMGVRLNYTLTDIASEDGRSINFPMLVDKTPDPTRNFGIMFVLEANYDFGYLVSSSCGQRKKLFVF